MSLVDIHNLHKKQNPFAILKYYASSYWSNEDFMIRVVW